MEASDDATTEAIRALTSRACVPESMCGKDTIGMHFTHDNFLLTSRFLDMEQEKEDGDLLVECLNYGLYGIVCFQN